MFDWYLKYLERKGRKSIILDRNKDKVYLNRYYALFPDSVDRERQDIPFNVLIHQFMSSDDPIYHTHPWNWSFSLILKGGYIEHTPEGNFWRGPGSWRMMRPNQEITKGSDIHWVEIPQSGKTWTLFIRGRTTHDWGFFPDWYKNGNFMKWVYWKDFLSIKSDKDYKDSYK